MILVLLFSLSACNNGKSKQKYTKTYLDYFDTATTVIGYADNEDEFLTIANLVFGRLSEYHKLYDIYNTYDDTVNLAAINATYGGEHKTFKVDKRIMDLLVFAKDVYTITNGETNIAMGSVLSIWHDYRERGQSNVSLASLPSYDKLLKASGHTDINNLILDEENLTVYISDPDMMLDVGAIAKGYAAEMIAKELEALGIEGYTLNVGGNIRTIGSKPDGTPWLVGVENPDDEAYDEYIEYINLSGEAFVTSGSYQRYYYVDGVSYHHIIDKDTLYPSVYFTSVSVLCDDSGLADALSTALFSMNYESGLALIEGIEGVEAMWYTNDSQKLYSSGLSEYIKQN